MKYTPYLQRIVASCMFLGLVHQAAAQTEWQSWNSIQASVPLTEKLDFRTAHLRTYSISNKFQEVFHQTSFLVSYDAGKRWDIQSGVQFLSPLGNGKGRTRIFARLQHTTRVANALNWRNALRLETNSSSETRFRQRIILSTRISPRKRLDFLNLSPSLQYALFYNIGGNPIRYYDNNKQLIARQTPDGFHRGRFTLNLNSKVNEYLQVNLYYMQQREFNTFSPPLRHMNVFDPVRNRIQRPFNNFNAIGISAAIDLEPLFD